MNVMNHRQAILSLGILLAAGTIAAASAHAAVERPSATAPSAGAGVARSAGSAARRLWERTATLSERAVDSASAGWEKFENRGDAAKTALVDARMHLDYARIDQITRHDPESAEAEIGRAQVDLDRALEHADAGVKPRIQAIRDDIGDIVPEFAREGSSHYRQLQAEYRNYETELQDLISGKYPVPPSMHGGA